MARGFQTNWPGAGPFPFERLPALPPFALQPSTRASGAHSGVMGNLGVNNAQGGNISPVVTPANQPFTITSTSGVVTKGPFAPIPGGNNTNVSGNVKDSLGSPLSGIIVRAYDDVSGVFIGQAATDSSGNFTIASAGYRKVYVVAFDYGGGFNALVYDEVSPV